MSRDVYINGLGAFLPGPPVPSHDMETYLGLVGGKASRHRALVLRQNKIVTRHYALDRDGTQLYTSAEMAAHALRAAAGTSEINLEDMSFLATSSTLGDMLVPGLASHGHAEHGLPPLEIANFQSVCASSLMALKSAFLQIKSGEHDCSGVSGSEFASRYFRPGFYEGTTKISQDGSLALEADFLRFTLSDGAGAAVMEHRPNERSLSLRIKWITLKSFADRFPVCMVAGAAASEQNSPVVWSQFNSPADAFRAGALMLVQDFDLMKRMIPVWVAHYLELIDSDHIAIDQIDYVCSHYSSHSLREEAVSFLRHAGALIDESKWFSNLATKGNTGTASIFIMLEELCRTRALKSGERILCHVPESGRALNGFMLLEVV